MEESPRPSTRHAGRARRSPAAWAGLALGVAVAACGHAPGNAVTATVTPSPTPAAAPLVAVLDHPFGVIPNTLRLLRVDGSEVASTPLRDSDEAVTLGGRRALIAGDGRIRALDEAGGLRDVEVLPATSTDALINHIVASPDGRRWVWASVSQASSGEVTSRVFVGGEAAVATLLVQRTTSGRALVPLAWTAGGPVVSDESVGIGGYILFRRGYGDTLRLDIARAALLQLEPSSCALSDLGSDGTTVCVSGGHEAANTGAAVTLRVSRDGREVLTVALPAAVAQAGAALLSPDGHRLTLAFSAATGDQPEQVDAEVIELPAGNAHALPTGLTPQGWLRSGGLIVSRDVGVAGGEPGTYVVAADGTVALVNASATVVGVTG